MELEGDLVVQEGAKTGYIDNIQSVTITDSSDNAVTNIDCTAGHVLKAGTFTITQTEV